MVLFFIKAGKKSKQRVFYKIFISIPNKQKKTSTSLNLKKTTASHLKD